MPTQTVPSTDLNYALLAFDKDGKERTDDKEGGVFSQTIIERAKHDSPTDIFFLTHGWKGDEPSAIDQFNRWIGAMWQLKADRLAMGAAFRPMFIGLHWPSQPWGNETLNTSPASGQAFDAAGAVAAAAAPDVETMYQSAVLKFGDTPAVRASLRVIYNAYSANPNSYQIPGDALAAYQDLATAVGFSADGGPEASPDKEGAALNPQAAVDANRAVENGASFGVFGSIKEGILGGLRQVSFWLMKHRGRTIGEGGMHSFLSDLMTAVPARTHLMGHSFGCVVVPSILGGPNCKGSLPRPVDSTVLVQGAVSLWSWGDKVKDLNTPGYYRNILANKIVSGPIVTTRSSHDSAVGIAYPAAVALIGEAAFDPTFLPLFGGTGSFGLQGTTIAQSAPMLDVAGNYGFQPGKIYNLEGSAFIPSHTGIDGPQVAHAVWQAAL